MKIICIATNYVEHAKELNSKVPDQPVFFMKPESAIVRNNKPFFYPYFSKEIHYELEIILHICRLGKGISEKFAHRYYDKIGLGVDFTARDIQRAQKEKGLPWEICKAFDGSAPISRFLPVTKFSDKKNINFYLLKNGIKVQEGNTGQMLFFFDQLISYVSQFVTLKMGDIIFTGTPPGVGPVQIGDHLQAFLEDEMMMDFKVK
jgi:acylpyruvate hydrolase